MAAIILKTVILVMGIIMFVITVSSLAKRRMNESFCLAWGIISVAIIVAGCMLHPSQIGEVWQDLSEATLPWNFSGRYLRLPL